MKKKSEFRIISPQTLSQQLKGEVNFHLIDTLTQNHFEMVHLPHATNICVFDVTKQNGQASNNIYYRRIL